MSNKKTYNEKIGVYVPDILLPDKATEMTKWSVVACDQYTSEPEYWEEVERLVGDKPSTLNLVFPEIYLENDEEERIKNINSRMKEYVENGILQNNKECFIYIDRKTSHAPSRKGIVMCVDLEKYDYTKGSNTLIRATEGTVIERLPPRIKIRKNATLELPHVMILIDDPHKTVVEPLADKVASLSKVYDFQLMMNGGHIKGYKIEDSDTINGIMSTLENLADPDTFMKKYNVGSDKGVLLFAVGDGNHSLASAKGHWENVKKGLSSDQIDSHPARFALVEIVNVHDEGIVFEPIHRVLFNLDSDKLIKGICSYYKEENCSIKNFSSIVEMEEDMKISEKNTHVIGFVNKEGFGTLRVKNPPSNLEVGTLQNYLDIFIKENDSKIDYIHGKDVVTKLGSKSSNMGFYLPSMKKGDLFRTVILDGVLPRKTFSMGEAEEKRFYLECRKITNE